MRDRLTRVAGLLALLALLAGLDFGGSVPGRAGFGGRVAHAAADCTSATPNRIAVNPSTNRVYVTNYDAATVAVIDGPTNRLVAIIPVGRVPEGVAVDAATNRVYVANGVGTVSVIDGVTNSVLTTITTGGNLRRIAVNSALRRLYVTDHAGSLLVVDTSSNAVVSKVEINPGGGLDGVVANSAANRIYVATGSSLAVVDGATNQRTAYVVDKGGAHVDFDPKTNRIYAVDSKTVRVLDAGDQRLLATIPAGFANLDVAVNTTTGRVYVTDGTQKYVVDAATNSLIATLTVGGRAKGVAVNPETNRIYTADFVDNTVSVIDGGSNELIATIPVCAPSWNRLSGDGATGSPLARTNHTATWDTQSNRVLVFGGVTAHGTQNDLWTFSTDAGWTQIAQGQATPPARADHTAVWDYRANRLLVFGGRDHDRNYGDLWQYTNNRGWVTLSRDGAGGTPSARQRHAAAWDETGERLLVFGGLNATGASQNDLWEYTRRGWRQLTAPSAAGSPPPRSNAAAVWDDRARRLLVSGGFDGAAPLGDLWQYTDAAGWQPAPAVSDGAPPPLAGHSARWDGANARMLVFGGWGGASDIFDRNGLWEYSSANGWRSVVAEDQSDAPSRRSGHDAVWDPRSQQLLVFGGQTGGVFHNDLWQFR